MNQPVTQISEILNEDHCDSCGKGLGYSRDIHADDPLRLGNLTDGGGQLCPACAGKVYPPAPPGKARIIDMFNFG